MAVFVNLGKALISQALINGVTQRLEYEHLPMVCFQCGHYGYTKEICPKEEMGLEGIGEDIPEDQTRQRYPLEENKAENSNRELYGPWMLVERKAKKTRRTGWKHEGDGATKTARKSRFQVLENIDDSGLPKARGEETRMDYEQGNTDPLKPGSEKDVGSFQSDHFTHPNDGRKSGIQTAYPSWPSNKTEVRIDKTILAQRPLIYDKAANISSPPQSLGHHQTFIILTEHDGIKKGQASTGNKSTWHSKESATGSHERQINNTRPGLIEDATRALNKEEIDLTSKEVNSKEVNFLRRLNLLEKSRQELPPNINTSFNLASTDLQNNFSILTPEKDVGGLSKKALPS
ncbi:hypothetical protein PVK06_040525 [Gossypium arboreum]|uniref:Uncharacterized protein n=1 Tax=Gossypium arboreum TaxID=29729 RepID=A0ABR0N5M6_GOSAR|nr:hypothetical protein PVK06_040525 [Gossypium arboreum]